MDFFRKNLKIKIEILNNAVRLKLTVGMLESIIGISPTMAACDVTAIVLQYCIAK